MEMSAEDIQIWEEQAQKVSSSMRASHRSFMLEEIEYKRKHGIFRSETPEAIFKSHLKWAMMADGNLCFVHNETMQAYKTDGYILVEPLIPIGRIFSRWASSMDL